MPENLTLNPLRKQSGAGYSFQVSGKQAVNVRSAEAISFLKRIEAIGFKKAFDQLKSDGKHGSNAYDLEDLVAQLKENRILIPISRHQGQSFQSILDQHIELVFGSKLKPMVPRIVRRKISSIFTYGLWKEPFLPKLLSIAIRRKWSFRIEAPSDDETIVRITRGGKSRFFSSSFRNLSEFSPRAMEFPQFKPSVNYLLQLAGMPVLKQALCWDISSVLKAVNEIGFPVVMKPPAGGSGYGVFPNLQKISEVRRVYSILQKTLGKDDVLVEPYVKGNNYRLLVLGSEVFGAWVDYPLCIRGNGRSTIRELIKQKNQQRIRRPRNGEMILPLQDKELHLVLKRQGLSLNSILPRGKSAQLVYTLNNARGAICRRISVRRIHPKVKALAVKAVRLCGLHHGGIDYISKSVREPPSRDDGVICEVQAGPQIYLPDMFDYEEIVEKFVDYTFKNDLSRPPALLSISRAPREKGD